MQVESGLWRVGIDDAPPAPMQIGSPEAGDFRGYEVDLLNALAERLGVVIEYRRALWSVIIAELSSGALDLVCSAATVTPQRAVEVDFCRPHLHITLALVTRLGFCMDWSAAKMGVRSRTTAEAWLFRKQGKEAAMVSESNEELYQALASGEIDGVIDDSPIARYFARLVDGLCYAGSLEGTDAAYGIAVQRGNSELREQIDRCLRELEEDGTLGDLQRNWF